MTGNVDVRAPGDFDPVPQAGDLLSVPYINLTMTPEGQAFKIAPLLDESSLVGVVEDSRFPIVSMRRREIGAPVHRYLQVPGSPSRSVRPVDLPQIEKFYRHIQGEDDNDSIGYLFLEHGFWAHFLEIDVNDTVIELDGGVKVVSVWTDKVDLRLPIKPGTAEQYIRNESLGLRAGREAYADSAAWQAMMEQFEANAAPQKAR